jgi:ParB-like chromosome segregation protein Spo0J
VNNHPIAHVWPMLDDEKLDELAEDIRQQGQLQPIWTFEGMILDGRNRFEACRRAEIKPIIMEYKGDEPTAFAVSLNDRRRHMGKSALAAVAAELEPHFAEDAKRRQKLSIKVRDDKGRASPVLEKVPQLGDNKLSSKAREEAAKSVGVNDRYVQDAKKVKAEAPEVFERLKAGKITLQDAKREVAKKPTDDWRKDERDRQERCEGGATVVANASNDKNLIAWAEGQGLAVRVDRGTRYGNPFVLGEDGDRNEVCDAYRLHYLPHKPSIAERAGDLVGKVLICHCYPERCHAEYLVKLARESVKNA